MAFEQGEGRGQVNKGNLMKVGVNDNGSESLWIKLIATNGNKGIGMLQNSTLGGNYKWGELVEVDDSSSSEIAKITGKVASVPNKRGWIMYEKYEKETNAMAKEYDSKAFSKNIRNFSSRTTNVKRKRKTKGSGSQASWG